MIATILPGSSNFHAVLYNERKVAKGTARLIEIKNFGILEDVDSFGKPTPEELRSYLETYSARNGRIRQTQFHLAISCKGQELSEDELLDLAHAYLKEMGYGQEGQPLLVYAHRDTDNNHIHIVTSRVAPDGRKINDSQERIRSQKSIDRILGQDARKKAEKDLKKAKGYTYTSMAQFKALLSSLGYESYVKDDTLYIKRQGTVQIKMAVSEIEDSISEHRRNRQRQREIKAILLKYRNINSDIKGLQADLKKNFGIDLIFFGRKDKPYGYIIIDHRNRQVLHGGHILKMELLLDFATPEERLDRIDAFIDNILAANPKSTTFDINEKLRRSHAYIKRGVLHYGDECRSLNPLLADAILRNDRISRIESFGPVTEAELDRLCKIYKVERKDLVSLSERKPESTRAVNQLRGIFDNPALDYKELKSAIRESGFQIHRTEAGDILAVNFNKHIIIDLRAEGFDLTRLDYKPKKKEHTKKEQPTVQKPKERQSQPRKSGIRPLRDAGGGASDSNREWEVGHKSNYDDIDDGRSLKI